IRVGGIVFRAQEVRQQIVIAPAAIAPRRPVVIVARVPTIVGHAVDRTAATEYLAARQGHYPAVQRRLRCRAQTPAEARAHDRRADGRRNTYIRMLLRTPGLD